MSLYGLLADLRRFAAEIRDTHSPDQEARAIAATAIAAAAPRRSGRLAGSVAPDASGVELAAPYAGPIAYGWPRHGITANPFVETGLSGASERILSAYENHAADALHVFARVY